MSNIPNDEKLGSTMNNEELFHVLLSLQGDFEDKFQDSIPLNVKISFDGAFFCFNTEQNKPIAIGKTCGEAINFIGSLSVDKLCKLLGIKTRKERWKEMWDDFHAAS